MNIENNYVGSSAACMRLYALLEDKQYKKYKRKVMGSIDGHRSFLEMVRMIWWFLLLSLVMYIKCVLSTLGINLFVKFQGTKRK